MKTGDELFTETEELDSGFFLTLKERQCAVNPYLANFMSEVVLKDEADKETKQRLLQTALVTLEIIGAGNASDEDYIKVSKESIETAEKAENPFDINSICNADKALANAINEAKIQVENLNDLFNEFYKTEIETNYIWEKVEIFLKSYWIEKQKSK